MRRCSLRAGHTCNDLNFRRCHGAEVVKWHNAIVVIVFRALQVPNITLDMTVVRELHSSNL